MTRKLYDEAPYETEFSATVVKCVPKADGNLDVELDRTLFFPEEGGQTPDLGLIYFEDTTIFQVIDVQIDKSNTITHTLKPFNKSLKQPDPEGIKSVPADYNKSSNHEIIKDSSLIKNEKTAFLLQEGMQISGKIDWKRRFYNMQQHSGEHIFSGLVNSIFGYNNVGFHLSDNDVTMDYDGVLTKEDVQRLEYEANKVIAKNVPITCYYPNEEELKSLDYRSKKELEGAIRIVKIEGCDICACCAPHVKSSAEVGLFKVISFQSWKGGTRVYALCGFRALEEFNKIQDAALEVSHEFSVPVSKENFAKVFARQNEAITNLKTRVSNLEEQLLDLQIKNISKESKNVILFTDGFSDILRRNKINELVKNCNGFCAVFDGNDKAGYSLIIASSDINCNDIIKILKEHFETRGGGKPSIVQGHVDAQQSEILELLSGI